MLAVKSTSIQSSFTIVPPYLPTIRCSALSRCSQLPGCLLTLAMCIRRPVRQIEPFLDDDRDAHGDGDDYGELPDHAGRDEQDGAHDEGQ